MARTPQEKVSIALDHRGMDSSSQKSIAPNKRTLSRRVNTYQNHVSIMKKAIATIQTHPEMMGWGVLGI